MFLIDLFKSLTNFDLSLCHSRNAHIFIPVTRRVKGYTRYVGKCVTGRRKRFRLQKYIFLIRITIQVDLGMSVWTLRSRKL